MPQYLFLPNGCKINICNDKLVKNLKIVKNFFKKNYGNYMLSLIGDKERLNKDLSENGININPTDFNKCFGFIYPNDDDTNVKLFTNKKTTKSTNLMYRNNIQHNILNNPTLSDSSDLKFAINLKQLGNLFFNDTKDFFELDSKKK